MKLRVDAGFHGLRPIIVCIGCNVNVLFVKLRMVQCFSNWVPRNPRVPRMGVTGSDRRKCVMAEVQYIGGPKFIRTSVNERCFNDAVFKCHSLKKNTFQ